MVWLDQDREGTSTTPQVQDLHSGKDICVEDELVSKLRLIHEPFDQGVIEGVSQCNPIAGI